MTEVRTTVLLDQINMLSHRILSGKLTEITSIDSKLMKTWYDS